MSTETETETENTTTIVENIKVPDEFYKIIDDFTTDITNTFPEYKAIINRWWSSADYSNIECLVERELAIMLDKEKRVIFIHKHCIRVFPERFFDILYQNADIFKEESTTNTEFLPGIVFKYLWTMDITDNTRETIWKYLQLILFASVNSSNSVADFGDSSKLFDSVNEDELKGKLQETMANIQQLFETKNKDKNLNAENLNTENLDDKNLDTKNLDTKNLDTDAEDIHKHLQGIMQGKLGKIAMEMAEEAAQNLNIDMDNNGNAQDMFQSMFKNPGKLMNMVKDLGSKLDVRIKSGEINESELISEGIELINKMKGMPGMENMQSMFEQMGIPGLGKNSKMNTGAMENQLKQNLKQSQIKDRMRAKINNKGAKDELSLSLEQAAAAVARLNAPIMTDDEIVALINDVNPINSNTNTNMNKSSNKKKANKKKKL